METNEYLFEMELDDDKEIVSRLRKISREVALAIGYTIEYDEPPLYNWCTIRNPEGRITFHNYYEPDFIYALNCDMVGEMINWLLKQDVKIRIFPGKDQTTVQSKLGKINVMAAGEPSFALPLALSRAVLEVSKKSAKEDITKHEHTKYEAEKQSLGQHPVLD